MAITKLVYCIRKREGMAPEDFHAYWLERHGPLVRSLYESGRFPGMIRYVQSHTVPGPEAERLQSSRGTATPYDGITEVWFDTERQGGGDGMRRASAEAAKILLEDEATFIDFAGSSLFMTVEHPIFDEAASPARSAAPAGAAEDVDAITRVKAHYYRFIDTKQFERLADLFCADAVFDMSGEVGRGGRDGSSGIRRGADDIARWVARAVSGVTSVHHGHMGEVEITGPGTAKAIWAMEDLLWWPDGAPVRHMRGFGHYHETYERGTDRQWRIKTLKLTRLRVEIEQANGERTVY